MGGESEQGIPYYSTILQLLVSIQGLVLNTKPFYNDPFRVRVFQDWLSQSYSVDASKQACVSMIRTLRNPLKGFEDLVARHFRIQAGSNLMNYYGAHHDDINESNDRIFSALFMAFEKNGACCGDLLDQIQKEAKPPKKKSRDRCCFSMIWNHFKNYYY